jgi:hypothetical protein
MTTLTAAQVAGIVNSGGGPPSGSTTAEWVAKARQESSFIVEKEDFLHSGHWGLWQISENHFEKYGSQYGTKENFVNVLKNSPLVQWNVARRLFADSGWAPWRASGGKPTPTATDIAAAGNPDTSVAGSGAGDVGEAVPQGLSNVLGNPIDKIADILQTVLQPITAAAEWIGDPHNWVRVVQVIGGIALGIVATSIVLRPVIDSTPLKRYI